MAHPSHDNRLRRWQLISGYFTRGAVGEAGQELRSALSGFRETELQRWQDLERSFPFAVSGVDPAEVPTTSPEEVSAFADFLSASHAWLSSRFAERDGDFWEEMASPGCYWVRFKLEDDFLAYKSEFSARMKRLQLSEKTKI